MGSMMADWLSALLASSRAVLSLEGGAVQRICKRSTDLRRVKIESGEAMTTLKVAICPGFQGP